MTLTRLIPSLRASLPDPLDPSAWPVGTRATIDDLIVDGVSLLHLAELSDTPAVLAVGGRGALVVRVLEASASGIVVNADLDALGADFEHARLIGRVSTARAVRMPVAGLEALLPRDVQAGDLIAVPFEATPLERQPLTRGIARRTSGRLSTMDERQSTVGGA